MTGDHNQPGRPGLSREDAAAGLSGPAAPVFVLSCARSGSTLLRYILDAHADLACPGETGIPHISLQLACAWAAILGTPLPGQQDTDVAAIPEPVIAEVRRMTDSMIGHHLAGRPGKQRFCDKSLGAANFADLLMRMYPQARFVCLVRHSMDFIKSAVEASPWGLIGFGFDKYAGPANMVCSLAQYWIDHTRAISGVALRYPGQSYLVRYEDLVEAPDLVTGKIFAFLGVPAQPGISRQCLEMSRERPGPGDHKIRWTSEVSPHSVGGGQTVPPNLMPAPLREQMNGLLVRLGYVPVERNWGSPEGPADPRVPGSRLPAQQRRPPGQARPAPPGTTLSLEKRLRRGVARVDERFRTRWQPCSSDTFACMSRPRTGPGEARWLIDLARRTMRRTGNGDYQWGIIGEPRAWEAVLSGRTDLSSSLRRGELRYCIGSAARPAAPASLPDQVRMSEVRVDMVGDLLGLMPWPGSERNHR